MSELAARQRTHAAPPPSVARFPASALPQPEQDPADLLEIIEKVGSGAFASVYKRCGRGRGRASRPHHSW